MKLVLASASPRRKELLRLITPTFVVHPAQGAERFPTHLTMEEGVLQLAGQKALEVAPLYPDSYTIGSDTVVELDGCLFLKPMNEQEAYGMLSTLSGRTHQVHTAVAIAQADQLLESFYVTTQVTFAPLSSQEIVQYIQTKEPMDKAGAYGIQGVGARLVTGIHGDYYAVMGLPVQPLYHCLKRLEAGHIVR